MAKMKLEIYTQYSDGEIELEEEYEEEYDTKEKALNELNDHIKSYAWYGSYVIGYVDGKRTLAKSIED